MYDVISQLRDNQLGVQLQNSTHFKKKRRKKKKKENKIVHISSLYPSLGRD